jgi:integrase
MSTTRTTTKSTRANHYTTPWEATARRNRSDEGAAMSQSRRINAGAKLESNPVDAVLRAKEARRAKQDAAALARLLDRDAHQIYVLPIFPHALSETGIIRQAELHAAPNVGPATRKKYMDHLHHFQLFLWSFPGGPIAIEDATRLHIGSFMLHLKTKGGTDPAPARRTCEWCRSRGFPDGRGTDGWSNATQRSYLSALRFVYGFAVDAGMRGDDPTVAVKFAPNVGSAPQYTPTPEDIDVLINHKGSTRGELLALMMLFAPARREPFSTMLWSDITGLGTDDCRWQFVDKGGKAHSHQLGPEVQEKVVQHRAWQLEQAHGGPGSQGSKDKAGHPQLRQALSKPSTAYVFMSHTGTPLDGNAIARHLIAHASDAGVGEPTNPDDPNPRWGEGNKLTPHSLRRAWATMARRAGHSIDDISQVLAHSSPKITLDSYIKIGQERAHAATVTELGVRRGKDGLLSIPRGPRATFSFRTDGAFLTTADGKQIPIPADIAAQLASSAHGAEGSAA